MLRPLVLACLASDVPAAAARSPTLPKSSRVTATNAMPTIPKRTQGTWTHIQSNSGTPHKSGSRAVGITPKPNLLTFESEQKALGIRLHCFDVDNLLLSQSTATGKGQRMSGGSVNDTVIYDFGANNGDDVPYYLMKAQKVVAVEANPQLCEILRTRFSEEIKSERLYVENCVITEHDDCIDFVDFYIHKHNDVLSQFPKPSEPLIQQFDCVRLPQQSPSSIIAKHGDPLYVKIDVEHFDAPILRHLFTHNIRPPFISAESHSIEVFALLVSLGGYNSFKLIDGGTISEKFANHPVVGGTAYSFPYHSAGPFGEDLPGQWMTADHFVHLLAFEGVGWKDIHATNRFVADPKVTVNFKAYVLRSAIGKLPGAVRQLVTKALNSYLPK